MYRFDYNLFVTTLFDGCTKYVFSKGNQKKTLKFNLSAMPENRFNHVDWNFWPKRYRKLPNQIHMHTLNQSKLEWTGPTG